MNISRSIFAVVLTAASLAAQDLSGLVKEIMAIEQRLTKLIAAESAQRKAADNELRNRPDVPAPAPERSTDSSIATALAAMENSTQRNSALIDSLSFLVVTLARRLDSIENAPLPDAGADDPCDKAVSVSDAACATDTSGSGTDEEKEALQIGGLVTVDAASDPTDLRGGSAEVGQVALSANVNVAGGIVASITVLAEGNMSELSIDQALVAVTPDDRPLSLLFGQQTFSFGLLSTRLISDPSIIDDVETAGPGMAVNYTLGSFTPGAAVTFFHEDAETESIYRFNQADSTVSAEESVTVPQSNLFAGIINCDLALPNESSLRLAARFHGDVIDLTLGGELLLGPLLLDAEFYGELLDDDDARHAGYYAGLAWGVNDHLEAALRYDGYSGTAFESVVHRLGVGGTVGFVHGIFCALEYSLDDIGSGDPQQELTLQVGLESTIKLPGFQRKTLTRK